LLASLKEKFLEIEASLCTAGQVDEALAIVEIGVPEIINDIKWLNGKVAHPNKWHSLRTVKRLSKKYSLKGVPAHLVLFTVFLYRCHDLGRFVEGCGLITSRGAVTVPIGYHNHGRAAVKILERLGVLILFDRLAQEAIRFAIVHHHDRYLRPLGANASKDLKVANFFAKVVRDWDMLGGLLNKTHKWLGNPEKKRAEMRQYGIGEEQGRIFPQSVLKDFVAFRPIGTSQIVGRKGLPRASWEAYMLSHLAWIFNISFRETLEILLESNVIEDYLEYFKKRLPKDQYELIRDAVNRFLEQEGFSHAF
jgi:hypothetical protein